MNGPRIPARPASRQAAATAPRVALRRPSEVPAAAGRAPAARQPAVQPGAQTQPRRAVSAFFRGDEGRARGQQELEHQKEKRARAQAGGSPFRYFIRAGEQGQYVILDDAPDFYMYEHAMRDSQGNFGREFVGCVRAFDVCPICQHEGKESYYGLFMTVLDLTPYTNSKNETIEFLRKLLVVKPAQHQKFQRMYERHGTLRGAVINAWRDGDKDAAIGNDIELAEFMSEDDLATYTRSWTDREGKSHTEDCSVPFVYEEIFEEPTAESLRAKIGAPPPVGSRAESSAVLGTRRNGPARTAPGRQHERPQPSRRAPRGDDWSDADDTRPYGDGESQQLPEEHEYQQPVRRPTTARSAQQPRRPPMRGGATSSRDPEGLDDDVPF